MTSAEFAVMLLQGLGLGVSKAVLLFCDQTYVRAALALRGSSDWTFPAKVTVAAEAGLCFYKAARTFGADKPS